jgi:hypothetical protein
MYGRFPWPRSVDETTLGQRPLESDSGPGVAVELIVTMVRSVWCRSHMGQGHWKARWSVRRVQAAPRGSKAARWVGILRGACRIAVSPFFRLCYGQGRRRPAGEAGFHAAEHLSGPEDQLRDRTGQHTLDRPRQSGVVRHASGSHNPDGSSDAAVAPDPVIADKSKHRCRCPADGGSQRSCPAYGGFSGSASKTSTSDRSAFTINSWNVGFQADVYQQNGGSIPTVTPQSTVTRSVPDAPLATTSLNAILEFDYALNKDETRGFLAGVQYTRVAVDPPLATINPNIVGYVGGNYQWDDNWKFSGQITGMFHPGSNFQAGAGQPIADF